jgi:hypothetical protein
MTVWQVLSGYAINRTDHTYRSPNHSYSTGVQSPLPRHYLPIMPSGCRLDSTGVQSPPRHCMPAVTPRERIIRPRRAVL